ncbi:Tn4652, cointegrate resolution protein T [Pseudomonas aeruginosa VRFPA09]|nr:Tn4652, cointegrate resolution protein T [Pseudomonas aeruginosa VRFPA09]
MASLERTAYPVLSRSYSRAELQREFSFSEEEVTWVKSRSNAAFRLNLAVLFKTFQVLRYFPEIAEVPEPVVDFIRTQIGLRSKVALSPYKWMQLYRHMSAVREKLGVRPFYGSDGQDIASTHAQLMAPLLEQRADIINAIIDELLRQNYELPAYSTLNDLAEAARAEAQEKIFNLVVARAPIKVIYKLRDLLDTDFGRRQSDFNTLKQAPKKPSRKHLEVLIDHLARLQQANHDQEARLQDRDGQIRSLEDKHEHARDALEHYRQASKEQREQEQRRHESQVQQLQLELRQLQQTLIVKQDELTHLNRDNARLLAEARQQQKDQHAQQKLLTQKAQALEVAQNTLTSIERTNEALEQRCHALQDEVTRLGEASSIQAQQTQSLQERLAKATAQLKLLGQAPPTSSGGASSS